MIRRRLLLLGLGLVAVGATRGGADAPSPTRYRIEGSGETWVLLREGEPFFIKGAVALRHFQRIQESGGNAVRFWRTDRERLDRASEQGLGVLVTLPVQAERNGFDWNDDARVEAHVEEILDTVRRYKDHPALMMWAVGNEIDWIPPGVPYNRRLWDVVNRIAAGIHAMDPHHPVMTVIGDSDFEVKIQEIKRQCPDLDLIGINSYADLADMAALVREHWDRPYVVTEWGPNGHWQVPKTDWGAPLEQTSSEKAASYEERYENVILADAARGRCLGSFVFLWDQKQEITHTWYGMVDAEAHETEAIEVMGRMWGGPPPANRAPRIGSIRIAGFDDPTSIHLSSGEEYAVEVEARDPDGDPLRFAWDVRSEVEPGAYAGHGEEPAVPRADLVEGHGGPKVRVRAPEDAGPYRVFVAVYDDEGHVALANQPFSTE
jgi:hypothetical protein